jgi:hypothetical protein
MASSENKESQKFLICKICRQNSALSESILTCEKCTSAIVNAALPYVILPEKKVKESCSNCGKELYPHLLYECDCNQAKFCFNCYASNRVSCTICYQLKGLNPMKSSIWSPGAYSYNWSSSPSSKK